MLDFLQSRHSECEVFSVHAAAVLQVFTEGTLYMSWNRNRIFMENRIQYFRRSEEIISCDVSYCVIVRSFVDFAFNCFGKTATSIENNDTRTTH